MGTLANRVPLLEGRKLGGSKGSGGTFGISEIWAFGIVVWPTSREKDRL
jgi:hypothetical protein